MNRSRVDYAANVIRSCAFLTGKCDSFEEAQAIYYRTQDMLATVWDFQSKVDGHAIWMTKAYWDEVAFECCCTTNSPRVYLVRAIFSEAEGNTKENASNVILDVIPINSIVRVTFALSPKKYFRWKWSTLWDSAQITAY